jgi:hypothetical protein
MKQTAVEWLIVQIHKHWNSEGLSFEKILEQAKAMEKQQIVNAFCVNTSVSKKLIGYKSKAEQYYNKTYEK